MLFKVVRTCRMAFDIFNTSRSTIEQDLQVLAFAAIDAQLLYGAPSHFVCIYRQYQRRTDGLSIKGINETDRILVTDAVRNRSVFHHSCR
jgi:hypothetical protein